MASPAAAPLRQHLLLGCGNPAAYSKRAAGAGRRRCRRQEAAVSCEVKTEEKTTRRVAVKNGGDSLEICRVVNGMWQTSGGWGRIDPDSAVEAMLSYADAGFSTFDMADIYGPAEDLYGMFINRVRRERPPELLAEVKGLTKWVPPPVKMTSSYVWKNIDSSRKKMDVASLDMLQFHWCNTLSLTCAHNREWLNFVKYGTVMGGLLSDKFLDKNMSIPFAGPPLNTPSLQKYKRVSFLVLYFDLFLAKEFLALNCSTQSSVSQYHWHSKFAYPNVTVYKLSSTWQMVDAWGGWSLFQVMLKTLKKVASKHGVSIPVVAVRYILDQASVAGSMVGVRLGLSEHIQDTNAVFSLVLDEEDASSIEEVSKRGRDLLDIIGDSGDEYRRA
ncbi:hypothetical protein Taro_033253 [Colocasia esculenta]|uniref:NADP-dependent oxidoreductase domain-containing protein n=1 Tax=Colocasia esculenta TaxID=4460 RepID=A0A843VZM3_COLES|nr:hypothetical protein [Colocasia esculenta]